MSDDIVDNLKEPSHWLRILFMLGFAVVLYVVGMVVLVLTLAQILFSLLTGKDNPNLRSLGSSLSRYIFEILMFLTYNSEIRPFPFTPFPVAEPLEPGEPAADKEPAGQSSAGTYNPYAGETAAETAVTEPQTAEPSAPESDSSVPDTEVMGAEVPGAGEVNTDVNDIKKPDH
jgi:hypothetical protein